MQDENIPFPDFPQGINSFLPEITAIEPAVSLQGGDDHTYAVAKQIAGLTADPEEALAWMLSWNKLCKPPWTATRVARNVRRAWHEVHGGEGMSEFYLPEDERPRVKKSRVNFKALDEVAFGAYGALDALLVQAAKLPIPPLEKMIDQMYPRNPLLCRAAGSETLAKTARRETIRGVEGEFEWLVPSPMSKVVGTTMDGENDESPRCRDNAGPRRYIVIEFDFTKKFQDHLDAWAKEGISGRDVQAALICLLATTGSPQAWPFLIVDSGNKSLHAWYAIHKKFSEQNALDLLSRAIPFGADPRADEPERFFRFPGGKRKSQNNQPQPVLFYDKNKLR